MGTGANLEVALIYDLHTHSNASDGILSPEALVSRAKLHGVTHLAVTDHDTINGLSEARTAADALGIDLINGIEFSSQWQGLNIHVVGLNIDVEAPALVSAVSDQHNARLLRAEEIANRLQRLGFDNCLEGARRHASGGILGRPHFARYLVEIGAVSSANDAFKRYLGAGKVGDVKQEWPEVPEVCEVIRNAGGVPVLAHPLRYNLTMTKLRRLLDLFTQSGGQAIEVLSGSQTTVQSKNAVALAKRFNLHASCGSDFHVPGQPWQELGRFGKLPEACLPVWELWQTA